MGEGTGRGGLAGADQQRGGGGGGGRAHGGGGQVGLLGLLLLGLVRAVVERVGRSKLIAYDVLCVDCAGCQHCRAHGFGQPVLGTFQARKAGVVILRLFVVAFDMSTSKEE